MRATVEGDAGSGPTLAVNFELGPIFIGSGRFGRAKNSRARVGATERDVLRVNHARIIQLDFFA